MDKVTIWFNDPDKGWTAHTVHKLDARHATTVDPDNWKAEKPSAEVVEEVIKEIE